MSRPPLDLHAELAAPDGTRHRWASERTDPGERPQNINFASKRFEGWERGSCQLLRPIDRDWPDLGLFDGIVLVGYDGSVAYEGMLSQIPRSTPNAIGVEATGWMAHARHRKFREIYVDRDLSRWRGPAAARRLDMITNGFANHDFSVTPDVNTGAPALRTAVRGPWTATSLPDSSAWYDSGGIPIGKLGYAWARSTTIDPATASWEWAAALSDSDANLASVDSSGNLRAAGPGTGATLTATTDTRVFAAVFLRFNAAGGEDGKDYEVQWTALPVFGNHGLTTIMGPALDGFAASDIIKDIAARFCPRLNTRGVQDTSWPVPQAAWLDRTDPYDAWLELNKYHLRELEVWEDRTLHYRPGDLTDHDWEVRTTDPGVSVQVQGDSTDHLANYAVVQFQNVLTGGQDEVSPDTHPELRDDSTDNPANRHGLEVEFGVTLSSPIDPDSAAQIGRALLAENNQPRGVGTITFKGHLRDRAGHWQQGWKVRAGQAVAVTNWPNNRPRLIGEVVWDHQTKTGTIAVDSTLRRVDAFLDRNATALRAAGLAS